MPTISEQKLKTLIKTSVQEVLSAELSALRALASSEISKREQYDLEKRYGKPSRKIARRLTRVV